MHSSFWISIFLGVFLARATPLGQASPPGQMSNWATNTAGHDPAESRELPNPTIFSPSESPKSNATKRANSLSGAKEIVKANVVARDSTAAAKGTILGVDYDYSRQSRQIPAPLGQIPTLNPPSPPSSPSSSRNVSSPNGPAILPTRDAAFPIQAATGHVVRRQLRAADYNSDGPQADDSDTPQSNAQNVPTNEEGEENGPQQVKERWFEGAAERVARSSASAAEVNDLTDGEGW